VRGHIIALREVKAMLRERSFVLLILLELLLVSSSGLLSIGYVILTSPESSGMLSQLSDLVYVGVVTDTRLAFADALEEGGVHHTFYDSLELARKDLNDGLVDAVLAGRVGLGRGYSTLTLYLPSNSPKTALTKLALRKVLLRMEDTLRDSKVGVYAPELEFAPYEIMHFKRQARYIEVYFIFTLPVLLFLPCVVSGSLVIDTITQDLESKRMLNLVACPLRSGEIVAGKMFGSFLLSLSQCILWLMVLSFTSVSPDNHISLIIFCALYTVVFMNVGCVLALSLKKMRASQILYTFVSISAISLFSPFANIHPILLESSPSYVITRMALGAPSAAFTWQLSALVFLAVASSFAVRMVAGKVNEL
jgi:ABC-2 type transport system permease protein